MSCAIFPAFWISCCSKVSPYGDGELTSQTDGGSSHTGCLRRLYARNVHNAMALENALLWLMIAAMLLRAAVYGALYFTLPRDARRVKENQAPPKPRDPEAELTGKSPRHFANHADVYCRVLANCAYLLQSKALVWLGKCT